MCYVCKVSTQFDYFLPRYVSPSLFDFQSLVLGAEFHSLSKDTIFNEGHPAKIYGWVYIRL